MGYGDGAWRGDQGGEMGDSLDFVNLGVNKKASTLHMGENSSCVVLTDGKIKCWGQNDYGQLGQGDTTSIGLSPNQMGDYLTAVNLGVGVEIELCYDLTPTSSPTQTLAPSMYVYSPCLTRFTFHEHMCALTSTQQLKCWGNGLVGNLGYGDTNDRGSGANEMGNYLPFVNTNFNVISHSVGEQFSCSLSSTFTIKCWGASTLGESGYGDSLTRGDGAEEMGDYLPLVDVGSNVLPVQITSGWEHTLIKSDQGFIKGWGRTNNFGQLGYGDISNRGNNPFEMGNYLQYVNLGTNAEVQTIKGGQYSSCVLLSDLSMKCWGRNDVGQGGQGYSETGIGDAAGEVGDYLPPISFPTGVIPTTFGTGWDHVGLISTSGDLFIWGYNSNAQIGISSTDDIGDDPNEMSEYLQPTDIGSALTVLEFGGGLSHSCAMLNDFSVKCWGWNVFGQSGYGDVLTRGDGAGEMGDSLPVVALGVGLTAQSIHIGRDFSCVVLNDNSFKCWGNNGNGRLGYGDLGDRGDQPNEMGDYLKPINLGTGVEIQQCFDYSPTSQPSFYPTFNPSITALSGCSSKFISYDSNCVITPTQQVKCWGENEDGRLGYGDNSDRGDQAGEMGNYLPFVNINGNVIEIQASTYRMCAFLSTFEVTCWGDGTNGQLGYGDTQMRGNNTNEMGFYLPTINFGSSIQINKMKVGQSHGLVLTDSQQVKSWGYWVSGPLGYENTQTKGDGSGEMGDYLPFVNLGTGRLATQCSSGGYNSGCVLDNGDLKIWGANDFGQLGKGNTIDIGSSANDMGNYLTPIPLPSQANNNIRILKIGNTVGGIITNSGLLYLWGANSYSQLGLGQDIEDIGDDMNEMGSYLLRTNLGSGFIPIDVEPSRYHVCAILDNFQIKCWGEGFFLSFLFFSLYILNIHFLGIYGKLGDGSSNEIGNEPFEMGNYLPTVNIGTGLSALSLHAGRECSCALLNDNSYKCWGYNFYGQLGYGDTVNRGDDANEMGDYLSPVDIGSGLEIVSCFDYSPTLSPSISLSPSIFIPYKCGTSSFSGSNQNCVLTSSNQMIKCWGENGLGQLGYGDTSQRGDESNEMSDYLPFVNFGTGNYVINVIATYSMNCAQFSNLGFKCWGYAFSGKVRFFLLKVFLSFFY